MNYLIFFSWSLLNTMLLCAQDSLHISKPVFISNAIHRVPVNTKYTYEVRAMDSSGLLLTYKVFNCPAWLYYDSVAHQLTGRPTRAGQYPVHIEVNNQHLIASQDFMLTVTDQRTTNLLCLGNSITNGTSTFNSYRRALWQLLHDGKYNVDFVGSWDKHHGGGAVPAPDFDMDHEGHSGWTFEHMFHPPSWDSLRGNIDDWMQLYKPDLVLLELGTNDVFQCRSVKAMLNDLSNIITVLRKKNDHVKIFLAQIPPLGKLWASKKLCGDSVSYDAAIRNLNRAFDDFSRTHSGKNSPVILVDQYHGINTDTEMYDDIHPNEAGEKKMAEKWFTAIRPYLNKLR